MKSVFSGFDAAWTITNCGAVAHIIFEDDEVTFHEPVTATYDEALKSIKLVGTGAHLHVDGIDQPLIVPNSTGCRPAERAFHSLFGYLKGGIQPANRGKAMMFGDDAPIWPFLKSLDACVDFDQIPGAMSGRFAVEIFPAAALAGLFPQILERRSGPRYNPARRTFRIEAWREVCELIGGEFLRAGIDGGVVWCASALVIETPRKEDQDKLDAVICALLAYIWWRDGYDRCLVAGDLDCGYIVTPTHPAMTEIVANSAGKHGVPLKTKSNRFDQSGFHGG